ITAQNGITTRDYAVHVTQTATQFRIFRDISELDFSGTFAYAVNCGQGVWSGNPTGDPFTGGAWGNNPEANGVDLAVGDAMFMADMWSMVDESRNYNRQTGPANPQTDADVMGTWPDDWRFKVERGAANGFHPGNDDGGIAGMANYAGGYHGNNNGTWQSPYEGHHNHNTAGLFGGSSTDEVNLRRVLGRSGAQNLGGYNGSVGERDMHFDFDVTPGVSYKLQVLLFKTGSEQTGMRIDVEGVTLADGIDIINDTDASTEGLVLEHAFTAGDNQMNLVIGRQTDGGGHNIGDVNAITLEVVGDDADGDGMQDTWEMTHFGDLTTSDGTGDHDGDGFIDAHEFAAGTLPTDDRSYLGIIRLRPVSDNQYELIWPGVTGKSYQVLYKTDLFSPTWMTNSAGIGGVSPFNVSTNLIDGERVYFNLKLE
ncbi:MAG: hypothetical protein AAF492_24330, partial [Verrucomicrobiota bacterium]